MPRQAAKHFNISRDSVSKILAYPAAVPEAWVDGHIHAFAFFGAVPQSIVCDGDLLAAKRFLRKALQHQGRPDRIVIDGSQTNREAIISCDSGSRLEDRSRHALKAIRKRTSHAGCERGSTFST